MKLGTVIPYLKKTKKYVSHVKHPLSCAHISIFSLEISKFCYIRKHRYRFILVQNLVLILLTFLESSKIFLINMVTILMMAAKLASPGLLTIKIFQNKGYDVTIPDYDVTNKILSRTSNYIVDIVM